MSTVKYATDESACGFPVEVTFVVSGTETTFYN
jgi:hypothetical protein